jgi:hypothetical protein
MKVRIVIDRIVVDGLPAGAADAGRIERAMRQSLSRLVEGRSSEDPSRLPSGRRVGRERLRLRLPASPGSALFGHALGSTLADGIWNAGHPPARRGR